MPGRAVVNLDDVNLHDWIDEACDALDLDIEVDEGLILDLTKVVADNVVKVAAPISAYILGYAAGQADASPEEVERLSARAQALAESWDRPQGETQADKEADDLVDDDSVDEVMADEEYVDS